DPSISSVTLSIMITTSNSPVKGEREPDQSSCPTALLVVLLEAQHLFDPVVNLGSAFALESDGFAGLEKGLDLIQTEFLGFTPFRLILCWNLTSPSGSSCIGQDSNRNST